MSNTQYVRTLFDDARYQLEGAVQSGAKWPPNLAVKPHVTEYKGYTQSFVRFVVRTNIEGDRNNGIIEVMVPKQTWDALGFQIASLTGEDVKFEPIECYERPFGKDRKPMKEDTLMGRIHLSVRDGRISIAVIDARNDSRVKIPFYFGHGDSRCPKTTQGDKGNFIVGKSYAQAWHKSLSDIMPQAFKELQAKALKNSTTSGGNGGDNNGGGGSNNRSNYDNDNSSSDMDDDLPF